MVARLTAAEIARAFLVHTLTMEQRSAARSGSPSWHFGASR
jgi:predicted RNA polymerase sigma factor